MLVMMNQALEVFEKTTMLIGNHDLDIIYMYSLLLSMEEPQ